MSRAEKLANAYVRSKEQTDLERWGHEARQATLHAEGCGCHQCVAHAEALRDRFVDESIRVNFWQPDQEENWIMNFALQRLEEQREDN